MSSEARAVTSGVAISAKKNALAALFVQGATLVSQLMMAPILIREWGADGFGLWVHAMALPLMLAYADIGVGSVAANKAFSAESSASGTINRALRIGAVSGAVIGLACLLATRVLLPPGHGMSLAGHGLLTLYGLMLCAHTVILAFGRNSPANPSVLGYYGACKVLEVAAVVVGCSMMAFGYEEAALLMCAVSGSFVVVAARRLRQEHPWLRLQTAKVTLADWREFSLPGLSAVAFPAGLAASLQWPILLASAHVRADQVATFVTMRTLARMTYQQANVVCSSFWGKVLRASVDIGPERAVVVTSKALRFGVGAMVATALVLSVVGPMVYPYWIGDDELFSGRTFALLLLQAIVGGVWLVNALPLTTTNRHASFAWAFIGLNAAAFAALSFMEKVSLDELVLATIAVEIASLIHVRNQVRKQLARA